MLPTFIALKWFSPSPLLVELENRALAASMPVDLHGGDGRKDTIHQRAVGQRDGRE
ncbi:MAG: hypothetical protein HY722_00070 [Planctomycetes bacterium]|nr:hypothetical protein [Planctomycetota bacterium]